MAGTHEQDLTVERSVNEQYQIRLKAAIDKGRTTARAVSRSRSQGWVGEHPRPAVAVTDIKALVGRVGLDTVDPLLGRGFYLGALNTEWGEGETAIQVVSWAARVASLFYEGEQADDPLAPHVVARRSFIASGRDISDFVDEMKAGLDAAVEPFASVGSADLRVPTAPRRVDRPVQSPAREGSTARHEEVDSESSAQSQPAPDAVDGTGLRAERAVRQIMVRPRTGHLSSVLATLQADQYRLVTWPADTPLVVQGQPGTGKTVIATHRAGYLVHPEREDGPALESVALIGPTDAYVDHVRGVMAELGAPVGSVQVRSLPALMRQISEVRDQRIPLRDDRINSDWGHARVLRRAARQLGLEGSKNPARAARTLVDALTSGSDGAAAFLGSDQELRDWLRGARSWNLAANDPRYLPFLAAAVLTVTDEASRPRYDHLIVDESQDVLPLEWWILTQLVRDGGGLSLFGDMNQRRSDWSASSWTALVEDLELSDDPQSFEAEVLSVGYRSTRAILEYANALLPKGERFVHALRDGKPPLVRKVRGDEVVSVVCGEAERLAGEFPDGLVGLISMGPQEISDRFRSRGWDRGQHQHSWTKDGQTVIVLHPHNARGLEFDGVVVVEPADFPENVGRSGLLYTSLTRATQKLVVVHSRTLPKALPRLAPS